MLYGFINMLLHPDTLPYANFENIHNIYIRPLFVDYLFQLHRPHQDFITASYCHYNHYCHFGIIISVYFSYRAVQNNYNQLVTFLESFQAITLVLYFGITIGYLD